MVKIELMLHKDIVPLLEKAKAKNLNQNSVSSNNWQYK
jgi:hypothetical protein